MELFAGAVGRGVVDEEDFFFDGRGVDGCEEFVDVGGFVVDGDDYGDDAGPIIVVARGGFGRVCGGVVE